MTSVRGKWDISLGGTMERVGKAKQLISSTPGACPPLQEDAIALVVACSHVSLQHCVVCCGPQPEPLFSG